MAKPVFVAPGDCGAVEAGTAVDILHCEDWYAHIYGTFVGTVSLQVSYDGTNWIDHPNFTDKTAPIIADGLMRVKQVRLNCTAYTSGTISCWVGANDTGA